VTRSALGISKSCVYVEISAQAMLFSILIERLAGQQLRDRSDDDAKLHVFSNHQFKPGKS
jgi:hypothetical protein